MGGLTLSLPGRESLSVTQIVFDEVTGLAAIMKLFDREPDDEFKDHTLLAPMMALSLPNEGLGFPSGTTLIPRLFLRNAGSGQAKVSLTVDWRSESKSGKFTFPQLALSSGEVRVINLMDQQKSGQVPVDATWGTVKLSYTGRRADLVAVALSYDKDNRYGLQTPFSEGVSRMWAGGMWHVDPTHNTFVTTGNAGPESTAAEVTLFYNGGKDKYRLETMLSPGQQMWLDVGQLIRGQIPDSDGHVLPPDAMNGSYELRDLDHATVGQLYEGKLVIDKTYGHASYGCSNCCGMGIPSLIPSPFGGPPGIDNQDFIHSTEQCSGFVDDVTGDGYGWSSSNTAVATLPTRTLHTVAVGTATGRAEIQLAGTHPAPRCPPYIGNPQQPVTVQAPTISSVRPAQGLVGTPIGVTITGTNFASGAQVSAGSNITVSSVSVSSTTQITATFTPTNSSSAGGNQAVTVTVGGQKSNSNNFYNQVPTHFQRFNQPPEAPGGLGPVITLVNGTAYNLSGTAAALNVCGVYENFIFDIADQQSTQITNGTVKVTEVFSNISRLPGPTPATNIPINLESQGMQDIQIYGFTYPTCPATNQNQNLDMTWTVLVGSTVYPATTVVHITKGNFNGTLNVTSNITTP